MLASVIFTTYNSTEWLKKVLWGFHYQTDRQFEIVVADDGSNVETRQVIQHFQSQTDLVVKHIWQEDNGFQKCRILNKAIYQSEGEYLIFTDGDCIPRNDFVAVHKRHAEPGFYLSGGYFKLPMSVSQAITIEDVKNGNAFDAQWLIERGLKDSFKVNKLTAKGIKQTLLNSLTPTKRTWNGHNASTWRENFFNVNGFDERMQYGGEDCEFGDRLRHTGIKAKQVRYSAICVHLDHARGYVNQEMRNKNKQIRKTTQVNKSIWTEFGLSQYSESAGELQQVS